MPGTGYGEYIPTITNISTDRYCTIADVEKFLPVNIIIETIGGDDPNPLNPSPSTITEYDIDYYMGLADSRLDGALATIYDVPLKKVNQGGTIAFPSPIPAIAAILSSQMIFEQRLQGVDRTRSESQKEREKWAEGELLLIQNGERRLLGQRNTRGNRFVRGTLPNVPRNPAEGGRSKGPTG
jgi:hypothetical protein